MTQICQHLTMPFFPMRPRLGAVITRENVRQIEDLFVTHVPQVKLNGDRACLAKVAGKILLQNRHGSWYKMTCDTKKFLKLPDGTCLDGEVYQKEFIPFEALSLGGSSALKNPVETRIEMAADVCSFLGIKWIWGFPGLDWLQAGVKNFPMFEGLVFKRKGSPYIPLSSQTSDSQHWLKRKWSEI